MIVFITTRGPPTISSSSYVGASFFNISGRGTPTGAQSSAKYFI